MTDHSELSLQPWELNYILNKFGKKESDENREKLRRWEKKFKDSKGGQSTKKYTKDEFYEYLEKEGI
ncbi:MAG: hypothetical protein ACXWTY_01825 [Methylobacter sp.]